MTQTSKSFVARIVFGAVALAGVAAAVPACAQSYDGRDWHDDHGWAERGFADGYRHDEGPRYRDGYRHDWRPMEFAGPGYYEGERPAWRPVHDFHRHHGHVVYVHEYDRHW
ncbi:hypothetical protein [Novosphingobium sp.]|uniref:hypothetical protein n=1 Tax=Novosphingobium sp. TaxID=1874826 RepID=UPI003D13725D